jgi:hypothetical protein
MVVKNFRMEGMKDDEWAGQNPLSPGTSEQ